MRYAAATFLAVFAVFVGALASADTRYIAADTVSYSFADPITLASNDSINNTTDATFDFTRDDAGTVTLTCSDNDATAALTILPGGAAAFTLGGGSTTSITLTTDGTGTGEVVLPLQSVAGSEMVNDTVDAAQMTDTLDLDADLTLTLGGGEQVIANKTATDATAENGLEVNFTALDTTSGTTAQYGIYVNNVASTEAADGLFVADNADADDAVAAAFLALNPTRFTSHLSTGNAALVIGESATDAVTITTDGTGTAELVLSAGAIDGTEILDGTVQAVDEAYAGRGKLVVCGDLVTISNNTVYYGPNRAVSATGSGGMTCDTTAAGNTTEATVDEAALQAKAFQVRGMICRTVDTNATVSFTLRTAAGATVPSVTCSTADNELDCVADVQTTTEIASGATIAVAAASTADVGTAAFVCEIDIAY